jgi:hypothetical protein
MRFSSRTAITLILASAVLAVTPVVSEAASRGGMGAGRGSAMTAAPGGFGGGGGPRFSGGGAGPRFGAGGLGRPRIGSGPRFTGSHRYSGRHIGHAHRPGLRPPSGRPHFKPGHRPGHGHHHRPHRPRIVVPYYYGYYGGPLYDGYYYDDSVVAYDDDCGWLYRKARQTGKAYWWRRYERCMGYE